MQRSPSHIPNGEAPGVTMSELLDAVDEKPRMVVMRKDERCALERDR